MLNKLIVVGLGLWLSWEHRIDFVFGLMIGSNLTDIERWRFEDTNLYRLLGLKKKKKGKKK